MEFVYGVKDKSHPAGKIEFQLCGKNRMRGHREQWPFLYDFFFLSVTLWAHKTSLGHINLIGFNFKAVVPKIVMSAFLERAPVPMLTYSELLLKISTELNLKTEKMLNNTIRLKCCPFESSTPPGLGTSLLKSFYLKIILENTLFFCIFLSKFSFVKFIFHFCLWLD